MIVITTVLLIEPFLDLHFASFTPLPLTLLPSLCSPLLHSPSLHPFSLLPLTPPPLPCSPSSRYVTTLAVGWCWQSTKKIFMLARIFIRSCLLLSNEGSQCECSLHVLYETCCSTARVREIKNRLKALLKKRCASDVTVPYETDSYLRENLQSIKIVPSAMELKKGNVRRVI